MASILLIDDDVALQTTLARALANAGHCVETARDGRDGIKAARTSCFDVLITDVFMPDQDGIETIRIVRSELPTLRIIAISGGGDRVDGNGRTPTPDYLRAANLLGASITLRKPFTTAALIRAVETCLGQREAAGPDRQAS